MAQHSARFHRMKGNRTIVEVAQSVHSQSCGSTCIHSIANFRTDVWLLQQAIQDWTSCICIYDAMVLALIIVAKEEGEKRLEGLK